MEIIGATEIILRAGAANSGELVVAIQKEFDLPFSPPPGIVDAPSHIGAGILPFASHPIKLTSLDQRKADWFIEIGRENKRRLQELGSAYS